MPNAIRRNPATSGKSNPTPAPVNPTPQSNPSSATGRTATPRRRNPSGPKGPVLTWDRDRDVALVKAARSGANLRAEEITEQLRSDPAFDGVESAALTVDKVRLRLGKLRADGINVPDLRRSSYRPDPDYLNSLTHEG